MITAEKPKIEEKNGALISMSPPETLFGYTYHAHMIPPFRPESVLILGSKGDTIARLIKKVWGETLIYGVDKEFSSYNEHIFFHQDALEFTKECKKEYDYVVVDLWNVDKVCNFIYSRVFIERLARICRKLLCVNMPKGDEVKCNGYAACGFRYERSDVVFGNTVVFWKKQDADK